MRNQITTKKKKEKSIYLKTILLIKVLFLTPLLPSFLSHQLLSHLEIF